MKTIGIRVEPKLVYFAIFDPVDEKVVNIEAISVPQAMSTPEVLKYIRNSVLDLLTIYQISKAAIRTTEPLAQSLSIKRLYIEGVIQEAFASSNIKSYYTFTLAKLAPKLGMSTQELKELIDSKDNQTDQIQFDLTGLPKNKKEALLSAIGAAK